jgi:NADH-quinone oxidoreductase subunit M
MPILLVFTVLLPLIGGLALLCLPGLNYRQARQLALGTALATFVLSLVLLAGFRMSEDAASGYQFTTIGTAASADPSALQPPAYGWQWVDTGHGPGIRFALGLDGVSLVLFVLTTLLMITSVFASWESVKERAPAHYALMLLLETGLLGLFASLDVVLFYIFFEFTLIPLFFLIGLYGGPERRRASVYFFLYTLAGSLLTLLGVITLVVVHYQHTGILSFSIPGLTEGLRNLQWAPWRELTGYFAGGNPEELGFTPWLSPQALIFLLLFFGFAIKVPLFPFHTWLPLAHVEAPTAGSILLAGVLLKVGGYGFLRFNLGMTPLGAHFWMPLLATLAVIGIIYGALTALAQSDVKRLVAYSSVSHMGFIMLGLFSLNTIGLDGAVIQMVNHGLTTGALFACVGVLYERYHTREMGEMGGIWNRLPLLAFFLILASLGSAAVPGLNGFVGEFPILLGMFAREPIYAVLATIGMVLGAYYLLIMLQRVLFGPLREPADDDHGHGHAAAPGHGHNQAVRPVGWHEIAGLAPLMVLIVGIGVYPKPIFERINPPLRQVAAGFYQPEIVAVHPNMTSAPAPPATPNPNPNPDQSAPDRGRIATLTTANQDPAR